MNSISKILSDKINELVSKLDDRTVLSGEEILKFAGLSKQKDGIKLLDYCYNRYDKGVDCFNGPFLFEALTDDSFRVLGENYKYSGDIIRRMKYGGSYVIGRWTKGNYEIYQRSDYGSRHREYFKYMGDSLALIQEGRETVVYVCKRISKDIETIRKIFSANCFFDPEIKVNPTYMKMPNTDPYSAKCDFRPDVDVDLIRGALVKYSLDNSIVEVPGEVSIEDCEEQDAIIVDNKRTFVEGDIVKHFKRENNNVGLKYLYRIIGVAEDTDTGEQMMVYQALYANKKLYVRPLDEFMSEVDHEKYPNVKQKYRFEEYCE